VTLERASAGWEALGAAVVEPGSRGWRSLRPGERGGWTAAAAGSAPADAAAAVISFAGAAHRVAAGDGVYLSVARVTGEPAAPLRTRRRRCGGRTAPAAARTPSPARPRFRRAERSRDDTNARFPAPRS